MKFAHLPLLSALVPAWVSALLMLYSQAARADALSVEFKAYDWWSLFYAASLGMLGGALALIVALASDRRAVREVWAESWRNALVSPIGGLAMYLSLRALAGAGWMTLSVEPRFALIVGAGWAGIALFTWGRESISKWSSAIADGAADGLKSWASRKTGGDK